VYEVTCSMRIATVSILIFFALQPSLQASHMIKVTTPNLLPSNIYTNVSSQNSLPRVTNYKPAIIAGIIMGGYIWYMREAIINSCKPFYQKIIDRMFLHAVKNKNFSGALCLIACGANPNLTIDSDLNTLLMLLVTPRNEVLLSCLLQRRGIAIDAQDNYGETALIKAAANGYVLPVHLLLENNARVDIQNNNGYTALIKAVGSGKELIVHLLLKKNPRVCIQTNRGTTALMYAIAYACKDIVQQLLEADATPLHINKKDNNGCTALMYAIEYCLDHTSSDANILKMVLDAGPIILQNNMIPFYLRSALNNCQVQKLLKDHIEQKLNHITTTIQITTYAISKKFDMHADESISTESFAALIEDTQKNNKIFSIAVLAAPENNYHFFSAYGLAKWFETKIENPNNRDPIDTILIYTFDPKSTNATFPFRYEEAIYGPQKLMNFIHNYVTERYQIPAMIKKSRNPVKRIYRSLKDKLGKKNIR